MNIILSLQYPQRVLKKARQGMTQNKAPLLAPRLSVREPNPLLSVPTVCLGHPPPPHHMVHSKSRKILKSQNGRES